MKAVPSIVCLWLLLFVVATGMAQTKLNFEQDKAGAPPLSFTTALTGQGRPGIWVVTLDNTAPQQSHVLAQTAADATGYRFPLCVYEKLSIKNVDLSVKFKIVSGNTDQVGGLLWRYRDKDNYYLARANALENNVVVYKMQNGKRETLLLNGESNGYGRKAKVPAGQWNTLRVVVKDNLFTVYLNGAKLYDVADATFTGAGKIGLWTKADAVTYYDELEAKNK